MNYLSLVFYGFIILFLMCYYILPQKYRYVAIFIGSYIFYGYANIKILLILVAVTVVTYLGGLMIEKKKTAVMLWIFIITAIIPLLYFKYTNFVISSINVVIGRLLPEESKIIQPFIALPLGLSFIVFQSCTYLTDVYRNNIEAEHNFIRYGAFVSFFPTVLSGPIQKARELLPQIACPDKFNEIEAQKGTLLFVWGVFEKIVVANRLSLIVDKVYSNYQNYNAAYYIIAAFSFSLYIYADFSSYSDMARGIAKIMGIDVGKNFNTPYLSITTSEFWTRWHTSLNSWLMENIYIPLGGNRNGVIRKYINIMIVFTISGIWHGANYHFVVWGIINGLLVIIGKILRPFKTHLYAKIEINENIESIRFCRQCIVFCLITITWIFFKNGIRESLYIIKNIVKLNPLYFFDSSLLSISGTIMATCATIIASAIFCFMQIKRRERVFERYYRQPFLMQCIPVAVIICVCIFEACSTEAYVNTQFLYFQF